MNFRLLLSIVFITTLISCGGAEERKAVYLEKAKASIQTGDFEKARIELKNVLQIDPKDADAYFQLGKIYEQQKDYRKAFGNYLKVEELNPDHLVNQANLGRIYLTLANDTDKAQSKIDLILSKDPNNTEGLLLKAAMMLKKKDKTEAINIAKEVVSREPGHVNGVAFLATLYATDGNSSDAINLLDNALKLNQDNEQLNKLLALFLVNNKDYNRAEVIFKKFLERNPDSISSYNNLAAFYNATDNKTKAEETLRASIENKPNDVDRQLILIKYILKSKSEGEAIDELKGFINKNSGLGKLRMALAELLLISGNKQSAIDVYNKAINDFSEEATGVEARISLASIFVSDKNYAKADEIVEEAILDSPNDPDVNLLRAKLAIRDNNAEKAILALRIVTKESPENIDAYILLAKAYQMENNEDQVKSTLNSAYDNNKVNPDALLKLAKFYYVRDIEQSEKIINQYNKINESNYEGLSVKATILNQKKQFSEANAVAQKLVELFPNEPNGYLQAIPFLLQEKNKQKAILTLENGYLNTKDNRKILDLLTTMQASEKQFDIVEKRLNAELDASPDDAELKILLSKVHMASNDIDSAITVLNEVIKDKPNLENPYLLLAQVYQYKKENASIISILKKGRKNVSASIKIPLRLASTYEAEKSYKKAIDVYKELHRTQPDNLVVVNNLASILSDYGDNKDDLELAKALTIKLEEAGQPIFLDTIGWVYYKLGDYQKAVQYLSQVVEKAPNINVFNYHLGMAFKMHGDKAQAKVYLTKSLADNKQFKEKSLAETALKDL